MLPEFIESQPYPQTSDDDVYSLVTAARQDGIRIDLKLSYAVSTSPVL
jgi:hypothetical protein